MGAISFEILKISAKSAVNPQKMFFVDSQEFFSIYVIGKCP